MRADRRFLEGLGLFNEGKYFECHEVIEGLWLETPSHDEYRDLYKGVIQAAAAIYQWDRGILTGARGLFTTAVGYLDRYRPEALGLDVDSLVKEMLVCFGPFQSWDGESGLRRASKPPVLNYRKS